jgi:hypothetical protein
MASMVVTMRDSDEGSLYRVEVPEALGPEDIVIVHDAKSGNPMRVFLVVRRKGSACEVENLVSPSGKIHLAIAQQERTG